MRHVTVEVRTWGMPKDCRRCIPHHPNTRCSADEGLIYTFAHLVLRKVAEAWL